MYRMLGGMGAAVDITMSIRPHQIRLEVNQLYTDGSGETPWGNPSTGLLIELWLSVVLQYRAASFRPALKLLLLQRLFPLSELKRV
jgi:hypothetical protein